jgi:uncharacterized protein YecE (DUF72 family)
VSQLGLFAAERSPGDNAENRALAARLPRQLRMGTSSWSFPGWRGIVWPDREWNDTKLAREGLAIYATHPLLRTVGIDRSYYGPISAHELSGWSDQVPTDFIALMKVWEMITKPWVRGEGNPRYLSVSAFEEEVLAPQRAGFAKHTGSMVLEIPAGEAHHPDVFARDLDAFFTGAPRDFPLAVEVRDRTLLTPAFGRTLEKHNVAMCWTFHPTMPPLAEQMVWAERHGLFAPSPTPLVARLMLPPGMVYEERRRACAPYDRLVDAQETMRRHVVDMVGRAVRAGRTILITVNNKAEGSAPLTIEALARAIALG